MALYQVTCIKKEPCAANDAGFHITEVMLEGPEGRRQFEVPVVRLMLSSDDTLTVITPSGATAEIRKGKCACGFKTLRTRRSDVDGHGLNGLPECD